MMYFRSVLLTVLFSTVSLAQDARVIDETPPILGELSNLAQGARVIDETFTTIDGITIPHRLLSHAAAISDEVNSMSLEEDIKIISMKPVRFGTEYDWHNVRATLLAPRINQPHQFNLYSCTFTINLIGSRADEAVTTGCSFSLRTIDSSQQGPVNFNFISPLD